MIGIFNNTQNPWVGKIMNEKVVKFSKAREYMAGEKPVKRTAKIITYNNIFDDVQQVVTDMNNYINMTDVVTLTDKNTAVIFSKKDFNPFITQRDKQLKDIMFISIDLKRRKILSIDNKNTFLLEGFVMSGELTLITSFNDTDSSLAIKLWDNNQKQEVVYTFNNDEATGKINMMETTESVENIPEVPNYFIKKFRPARPTYIILTYKKDKEQLLKVVKNADVHSIVEISKQNMDEVIESLQNLNYKAVTLFINAPVVTKETERIYGAAMTTFSKGFRLYFELLNTGKISKVKMM